MHRCMIDAFSRNIGVKTFEFQSKEREGRKEFNETFLGRGWEKINYG